MAGEVEFVKNMKIAREFSGWSQAEFARRLREAGLGHFHQNTLSRVEKGERELRLAETEVIAGVLGVGVELLLRGGPELGGALQFIDATRAARSATEGLRHALAAYISAQAFSLGHLEHFGEVPPERLGALEVFARGSVVDAVRDMLPGIPGDVAEQSGPWGAWAEAIVRRTLDGEHPEAS